MTDKDEWGPWIEHDGKGCPCRGMWVQAVEETATGKIEQFEGRAGSGGGYSWEWKWATQLIPGEGCFATRIIRYRIRKPRGLTILETIAREVERVDA